MELEPMLRALGEPTRLALYRLLLERPRCVRALSGKLGITESAVSQHLKVMKEAGLVYGTRRSHHIHYAPSLPAVDFLIGEFEAMRAAAAGREKPTTEDCNR